jgi:hypothetical protein
MKNVALILIGVACGIVVGHWQYQSQNKELRRLIDMSVADNDRLISIAKEYESFLAEKNEQIVTRIAKLTLPEFQSLGSVRIGDDPKELIIRFNEAEPSPTPDKPTDPTWKYTEAGMKTIFNNGDPSPPIDER